MKNIDFIEQEYEKYLKQTEKKRNIKFNTFIYYFYKFNKDIGKLKKYLNSDISTAKMRRKGKFKANKNEVLRLYKEEKLTKTQIAEKFNVSFRTIYRYLKEFNI